MFTYLQQIVAHATSKINTHLLFHSNYLKNRNIVGIEFIKGGIFILTTSIGSTSDRAIASIKATSTDKE